MDLKQGKVTGNLQRVTRDLSTEVFPSVSANQRLAFSADRSGKREIWVKDLATGKDMLLGDQYVGVRLTEDHAGRVEGGVCSCELRVGRSMWSRRAERKTESTRTLVLRAPFRRMERSYYTKPSRVRRIAWGYWI